VSGFPDGVARKAHLNLVESSRRLFLLDPGVELEEGDGWLFGAGTANHPTISNAAFRVDDETAPDELLARAEEYFGAMGRGFVLWARVGLEEDRDLIAAAEAAGLVNVYEMPEMVLGAPVAEEPLPQGAEVRPLATREEAEAYWRIAATAYESIGFPPEVFDHYQGLERRQEDSAIFLGTLEGEPVSIAMALVSHAVGGVYWVGSLPAARGKGLGRAVTAAATNAGFELGAELASLQASPMGEPIYAAMGYEAIYRYRLLYSPGPS
jgi:GNAT superfamily N-acetyltransferase